MIECSDVRVKHEFEYHELRSPVKLLYVGVILPDAAYCEDFDFCSVNAVEQAVGIPTFRFENHLIDIYRMIRTFGGEAVNLWAVF